MEMVPLVKTMAEYSTVPLIAKPNAGLPELEGKKTVYRMTPEEFAEAGVALVKAGAATVGGCCGTTKEHIRALADAVRGMEILKPLLVREMAMAQEENGARILDINMGMNGIDEKEMMKQVIYEVSSTVDCPLCIDTSHIDVMEEALRIYPGRALINSISLESEKIEKMLPWHMRTSLLMVLLPRSEQIRKPPENVMRPLHTVKMCASFRPSVVCPIFHLDCRSVCMSTQHS